MANKDAVNNKFTFKQNCNSKLKEETNGCIASGVIAFQREKGQENLFVIEALIQGYAKELGYDCVRISELQLFSDSVKACVLLMKNATD